MPRGQSKKLSSHEFVTFSVKYLSGLEAGHAAHVLEQIAVEVKANLGGGARKVVKRRKRRTAEEIATAAREEAPKTTRKASGGDKSGAAKPAVRRPAVPRARNTNVGAEASE